VTPISVAALPIERVLSPDGRYLAFAAQTGGRDALYLYDLKRHRVIRKLKFELDGIESPMRRTASASFLSGWMVGSAICS
jgi:hypothetical protein